MFTGRSSADVDSLTSKRIGFGRGRGARINRAVEKGLEVGRRGEKQRRRGKLGMEKEGTLTGSVHVVAESEWRELPSFPCHPGNAPRDVSFLRGIIQGYRAEAESVLLAWRYPATP